MSNEVLSVEIGNLQSFVQSGFAETKQAITEVKLQQATAMQAVAEVRTDHNSLKREVDDHHTASERHYVPELEQVKKDLEEHLHQHELDEAKRAGRKDALSFMDKMLLRIGGGLGAGAGTYYFLQVIHHLKF